MQGCTRALHMCNMSCHSSYINTYIDVNNRTLGLAL